MPALVRLGHSCGESAADVPGVAAQLGESDRDINIPSGTIPQGAWGKMNALLSADAGLVVRMAEAESPTEKHENMASFSSMGPTLDGRIKPDIVAPGDSITSSSSDNMLSTQQCTFTVLSGTSTAAPSVAAGALLVRARRRSRAGALAAFCDVCVVALKS